MIGQRTCAAAALAFIALGGILSCAAGDRRLSFAEQQELRQRYWQSRFRPVAYRIAEPDAGALNERITVRGDGVLEMSGRVFGTALAQLPPEEVARLAESFAEWQRLNGEYVVPGETQTVEELTYGGKTVRVRGNPQHLPPAYTRARAALVDAASKLRQ
jgi:hypothetical protein